jgi:hypothetical protein
VNSYYLPPLALFFVHSNVLLFELKFKPPSQVKIATPETLSSGQWLLLWRLLRAPNINTVLSGRLHGWLNFTGSDFLAFLSSNPPT